MLRITDKMVIFLSIYDQTDQFLFVCKVNIIGRINSLSRCEKLHVPQSCTPPGLLHIYDRENDKIWGMRIQEGWRECVRKFIWAHLAQIVPSWITAKYNSFLANGTFGKSPKSTSGFSCRLQIKTFFAIFYFIGFFSKLDFKFPCIYILH